MIEKFVIFSIGNRANDHRGWNLKAVSHIASRLAEEILDWEASSVTLICCLLNSSGSDVIILPGVKVFSYVAAFR